MTGAFKEGCKVTYVQNKDLGIGIVEFASGRLAIVDFNGVKMKLKIQELEIYHPQQDSIDLEMFDKVCADVINEMLFEIKHIDFLAISTLTAQKIRNKLFSDILENKIRGED